MSGHPPSVSPGLYRHYKGTLYRVLGAGIHTETEEPLVMYYQADMPAKIYARPVAMFADLVAYNGQTHPRFTLVALKAVEGESHG